ncbi:type II toxin-antitoxin system YafQ family toxin [Palleniella muris]|uniref:Type II toxin-antitoxin system YafQ family toxin n=1 Tax=Palleniella muris TaxID=3038145 RepID=A0AC61QN00_9BACT|nr:type II toxin-antitoxin system YafQ family toxin [Palleniella muris]TGX80755.1 type II toxin-antitoxin system YafQ family toxin [Palleniella muris]
MKEVKSGKRFKKDLKCYSNQPAKLKKLYDLVDKLRKEETIPASYRPHMLSGEYAGHMECHIEGDFLLIWYDRDADVIKLIRLGSHSELFG